MEYGIQIPQTVPLKTMHHASKFVRNNYVDGQSDV